VTERHTEASLADQLGELLRLVWRSDVEELEVEHEDARFLIRRDLSGAEREPQVKVTEPETARPAETYVITAPMVGIFHRTSGGGSEQGVEEGQTVTVGQVVGAVEAMRMLNRVQSERAGIVQEVLVHEGQPVEYGQALLVLREP
jgi:acetyl-CoA carboxylase biotin carboxyl carrier protein